MTDRTPVGRSPSGADCFDLLIRNATLIDGTNSPRKRADVGVRGDRIAAVAPSLDGGAEITIDAGRRVLAPGFIDAHTHDDIAILEPALIAPKLLQGVTTVVTGNCGISAAPWSRPGRAPAPLDLLDRGAVPTGRFADYAQRVRSAPAQLNAALLVGLTTVRAQVMDDLSLPADARQIEAMQSLIAEALDAGARGVSIGTYYPPARASTADEIVAACAPMQPGRHVLTVHLRDEGDHVMEALEEAIQIATRLDVPLVLSHHKLLGTANHGRSRQTLERIDRYARLAPVCLDCYPYAASSTMLDAGKVALARRVQIAWSVPFPEHAGKDLDDIARNWHCSRAEAAERLSPGGAIYFAMDMADVRAILAHPLTMVGSDGLPHDQAPHPRLWGSFARVLGRLVREEQWLTLETAVHKMTQLPAQRFGLVDRGRIEVGAFADLVLFDPERVSERATYETPTEPPLGIDYVVVNGQIRVADGQLTGRGNGRILMPVDAPAAAGAMPVSVGPSP